jgi:hypothetical protein
MFTLEGKSRCARDHFQIRDPRQGVDDLFRKTVAEVLVLLIAAHVLEWQDRDRRLESGSGRHRPNAARGHGLDLGGWFRCGGFLFRTVEADTSNQSIAAFRSCGIHFKVAMTRRTRARGLRPDKPELGSSSTSVEHRRRADTLIERWQHDRGLPC